jgi:hypothetical protein
MLMKVYSTHYVLSIVLKTIKALKGSYLKGFLVKNVNMSSGCGLKQLKKSCVTLS